MRSSQRRQAQQQPAMRRRERVQQRQQQHGEARQRPGLRRAGRAEGEEEQPWWQRMGLRGPLWVPLVPRVWPWCLPLQLGLGLGMTSMPQQVAVSPTLPPPWPL